MAVLRDVLLTTLSADATLAALLTGGVLDVSTMPQDQGGAGSAPRESDGITIMPHARVRFISATPIRPARLWRLSPKLHGVEVYLYQPRGYDSIDAAMRRLETLLHDTYLDADDTRLAHFEFAFESTDLTAEELEGAAMRFCRFTITLVRA